MKKKQGLFANLFSIFHPKNLLSYQQIRSGSQVIADAVRNNFTVKKAERMETFEEALVRLNLTEAEAKRRGRFMGKMALFFMILTVLIFSYVIYMLWHETWMVSFVGAAIATYTGAQAFRYHFWYFQIKRRRLGCTFKEWFFQGLLGMKS